MGKPKPKRRTLATLFLIFTFVPMLLVCALFTFLALPKESWLVFFGAVVGTLTVCAGSLFSALLAVIFGIAALCKNQIRLPAVIIILFDTLILSGSIYILYQMIFEHL